MASITVTRKTIVDALVEFALNGNFPERDLVSALILPIRDLPDAIAVLDHTRSDVEAHLRIKGDQADQVVALWLQNTLAIEADILTSKSLVNDIIRRSEGPIVSGKLIRLAEHKLNFLQAEVLYSHQILGHLEEFKAMNALLEQARAARDQRLVHLAVESLQVFSIKYQAFPVGKKNRVMELLSRRSDTLGQDVCDIFGTVWQNFVVADASEGTLTILESHPRERMIFTDVICAVDALQQVNQRMAQLWDAANVSIISPRISRDRHTTLHAFVMSNTSISRGQETGTSIQALGRDLNVFFTFLSNKLPDAWMQLLFNCMMNDLITAITDWLVPQLPSSLREFDRFRGIIQEVTELLTGFNRHPFYNDAGFKQWIEQAPLIWLRKCQSDTLDAVRKRVSKGILVTMPRNTVKIRMITEVENPVLWSDHGDTVVGHDYGKPSVAPDDHKGAWDWNDDEVVDAQGGKSDIDPSNSRIGSSSWNVGTSKSNVRPSNSNIGSSNSDMGPSDWTNDQEMQNEGAAWGDWDDEFESVPAGDEGLSGPKPVEGEYEPAHTERVTSQSVIIIALIKAHLREATAMSAEFTDQFEESAIKSMFDIPRKILALFRAISPESYASYPGGLMYLYNDASFLASMLGDFVVMPERHDVDLGKYEADDDIQVMTVFAERSYEAEMSTQTATVLDLLGGAYNLLDQRDTRACIDQAVAHTVDLATLWRRILSPESWAEAIGTLADTISKKLIQDMMDMPSISPWETNRLLMFIDDLAKPIDEVFLQKNMPDHAAEQSTASAHPELPFMPITQEYVESWGRLGFLRQLLQTRGLDEIEPLWFNTQLSYYFTADEIVDFIHLRYSKHVNTKDVIQAVQDYPEPLGHHEY